ncbi:hypothetical protein A9507_13595 [Methanobacterium sp. A39]|uniref:Uncharacterized protein n=1 Tax=Methanobacterium bryantii TaxID=2161 RepID=A0A2A2H0T6_METBR|nr:hypothetical protein A9507_13595 [Methanobacterium sp. A39]PAV03021.1 hypothetical protein ASJ80_07030 [Methanobacterium bryantii]
MKLLSQFVFKVWAYLHLKVILSHITKFGVYIISLKKLFSLKISNYLFNLKNARNKFLFLNNRILLNFFVLVICLKTFLYEFIIMVTEFTMSNKNYKFNINEKT